MAKADASTFKTMLLRPAKPGKDGSWAFLVLPKTTSDTLPRRGRTSVEGTINGHPFQATLEPDGQLSHWLKVSKELTTLHSLIGETITAVTCEPEKCLCLSFSNEETLSISLADADYTGPEAYCIHLDNVGFVVD